jgi:hypothetical protein
MQWWPTTLIRRELSRLVVEAGRNSRSKTNKRYSKFLRVADDQNFETNFRRLDDVLTRLSGRSKYEIDRNLVKTAVRKAILNAAHADILRSEERPAKKAIAKQFLSKLDTLKDTLSYFRKFDIDSFPMEVLNNLSAERRHYETYRDHASREESIHEAVIFETERIVEFLIQAEMLLSDYLKENVLQTSNSSNRTDIFIRSLVFQVAEIWRRHIRPTLLRRRDRKTLVSLIGAALDDFGYPRSEAQENDVWLYDRVGRYKIWN